MYIQKYNSTDSNYGYNVALGGDLISVTPVIMYSYDGEFLEKFSSYVEATCKTNIDSNSISNACNGYSFSAGGYIWRKEGDSFNKFPLPSN